MIFFDKNEISGGFPAQKNSIDFLSFSLKQIYKQKKTFIKTNVSVENLTYFFIFQVNESQPITSYEVMGIETNELIFIESGLEDLNNVSYYLLSFSKEMSLL